jgi:iron(III) transport system permease protein
VKRMTASVLAAPLALRGRGGRAAPLTALGVLGLVGAFAVWPVTTLIGIADPRAVGSLLAPVARSLAVAALVAVLTVAAALPLAYGAARAGRRLRRLALTMALFPLFAPPFLTALGLGLLLGRDGALTLAAWSITGYPGVVLAQIVTCLPWAFVPLAGALGAVEPALEETAEVLGAGPFATLWNVTLRLARPGVVTAALLVFIQSLGDLASPWLLGGGVGLAPIELYRLAVREPDLPAAATLGLVLLVLTSGAFVLGLAHPWRRWWASARIPVAIATERAAPAAARWPVALVAGGLSGAMALLAATVLTAALSEWAVGGWPGPGGSGLVRSLGLAVGAGLAGTTLALLTAYLIVRRAPTGGAARVLLVAALLPLAVPGPVLGLGYLAAFGSPSSAAGATGWLVAALTIEALPVGLLVAMRAVAAMDPAGEEAARGLGLGPMGVVARVIVPSLGGAARLIFLWFFAHGLGTVAAVAFLVPDRWTVAPVLALATADRQPGVAAALAVLITVMIGAAAGLLWVPGRRRGRARAG